MVVVPAAPHYQGQLHQDQLRFKAFEIAMRVFCQRRVYQFQNLSEMCEDLRLSSFRAIKHAVKKCTSSHRIRVGPTVVHGCIFLVGRGCSSLNYSTGRRASVPVPQRRRLWDCISVIYELPPNLIRFSNIST